MIDAYGGSYYRRREKSARDLADRADDPAIRQIHEQLADRYGELAQQDEHEADRPS